MHYIQQFIQLPWWKWVAVSATVPILILTTNALMLKFFGVGINIRHLLRWERKSSARGSILSSTGSIINHIPAPSRWNVIEGFFVRKGFAIKTSFVKTLNWLKPFFPFLRKKISNGATWMWKKVKSGASFLYEKIKRQLKIFSVLYKKRALKKSFAEGKDPKAESEVNRFQVGILLVVVLFGFYKFHNWNLSPSGFFTRFWTSLSGWFRNIDFASILIIVAIAISAALVIYLIYRGSRSLSIEDGTIKLPKRATDTGMQHIPISNIFKFLGVLVFVLIALATARWVLSTFYNDWYTTHVLTDRAWVLQGALFITLALWMLASSFPAGRKYVVKPLLLFILLCVATTAFTAFDYNSTKAEVKGYFTNKPVTKTSAWNWQSVTCVEDDAVREAFPDDTTMWKIARAESNCMQFESNNSAVVRNPSSSAVGIFQILEKTHGRDCGIDGVDIHTLEGNIACARKLSLRNPNYSDWDESAGRWRDGARTDTVPESVKIEHLTLAGDSTWSIIVDTQWKPLTYAYIGHGNYSVQVCSGNTEDTCGKIVKLGSGNTTIDASRFVRVRSDSSETQVFLNIGKKQ